MNSHSTTNNESDMWCSHKHALIIVHVIGNNRLIRLTLDWAKICLGGLANKHSKRWIHSLGHLGSTGIFVWPGLTDKYQ